MFVELDGDEDHFRPLVIDTRNSSTEGATSMEQDKQRLLRQLSQEIVMSRDLALYRENNPPSDAEGVAGESEPEGHQSLRAPGIFSGVYGGHSDSSTPSSRVPSPSLSTASNSGGSSGRSKLSHPQKARRKTDKVKLNRFFFSESIAISQMKTGLGHSTLLLACYILLMTSARLRGDKYLLSFKGIVFSLPDLDPMVLNL